MKYTLAVLDRVRTMAQQRWFVRVALYLSALFITALIIFECQTSWLQSIVLTGVAKTLKYQVAPGPAPSLVQAPDGPYDRRLGYTFIPQFIDRVSQKGFVVSAQARPSVSLRMISRGFFPPYPEKTQAGLVLADHKGRAFYGGVYPKRIYSQFETIPEPIVKTLLFIENRELLDARYPFRNPAIEWDRLAKVAVQYGISKLGADRKTPGGSTLATQMEKYRHSPEGRTDSPGAKFQQMTSASLKAYLNGIHTLEARKQIALDYLNSIPLGGIAGYGEIIGLGDGLWAWYQTSLEAVGAALSARPSNMADSPGDANMLRASRRDLSAWATAYKQVLSLLLAQRRPWFYLVESPDSLGIRTNGYLRVLANAGILTAQERDAALKVKLAPRRRIPPETAISFATWKTANVVRPRLLTLLEVPQFYDLDRLDLSVQTTLDKDMQEAVTQTLLDLRNPIHAEKAELRAFRMLEHGDPSKVIYSFTLYERGEGANRLRVQTDNFEKPLNIDEGIKLEMGSSAKLRTFITYLEIIADLHEQLSGLPADSLKAIADADRLTLWAARFLTTAEDTSLEAMLDASLNRMYSASPIEKFFTGGGQHSFANFDSKYDHQVIKLREALYHSVNLVFVRLMRDIVNYHIYQRTASATRVIRDPNDPRRHAYLVKFADSEGRVFQSRFYKKYQNQPPDTVLATLVESFVPTPRRLAIVFRTVRPDGDLRAFAEFMRIHLPESPLSNKTLRDLYTRYAPDAYSLVDRAFLARIHPLELWTAAHLYAHPKTGLTELFAASEQVRVEVYTWLFKTSRKRRQDKRIRSMLELEAFQEIHRSWKRLRYPFDSLVPSLATALGSSADRPAALAELMGILVNDGMWYPSIRIESLQFASQTPYETSFRRSAVAPERVIRAEVAHLVKKELAGVVEQGTGQRVKQAFRQADGKIMAVGGKTGTGDNRHELYSAGGHLIKSWVVNRTATFVFTIGDRYFGVISAYVEGSEAAKYRFTSALPVQVLKVLAPKLMPFMEAIPPENPVTQKRTPSEASGSSSAALSNSRMSRYWIPAA